MRTLTAGLIGCALLQSAIAAETHEFVYVGTHGASAPAAVASSPPDGSAEGIYQLQLDPKSGHLTAPEQVFQLQRATWLVTHPKMPAIYSVAAGTDSQANSDLYSFKIDPKSGHLQMMNKVDSGGRDATALDLDVPTQTLFAAHYASGSLSAVPIQSNAELGPVAATQTETGSGPSPRQKSAHAHGVAIAPGHNYALVTDLGADRVFIYRFDPTTRSLSPAANAAQEVAAGSGPRHLVFHPNGKFVFIDTELTAELRSYRWDGKAGRLTPVQVIQAYPAGQSGEKSAAELAVSKDGRFAYLSLRGDQDSIVVYAIDTRRGTLTEIQRISSQGRVPWSFGIDPSGRWMLVTNEGSNSVVVLKVDSSTGRLSVTGESATVPKPVTVTFYEPFK